MYLEFFGFKKEPFHITPDPEFLYVSPSHKEALAVINYGVEKRVGFMAILGGAGLGKTTILRTFLERANKEKVKAAFVFNVNVSYKDLLKAIHRELGLDLVADDVPEMVNHLRDALIEEHKQGRKVVLIIDEAQNMPVHTLENLRMLSNLEVSKDNLVQILLVGQSEFEDKLNLPELRQLKQRIAVRTALQPLTPKESLEYIRHRLSVATGSEGPEVFTQGALRRIVRYSEGIPRKINIVCDNAFITSLGYAKKPVTSEIVKEVIADLEGKNIKSHLKWVLASAVALILLLAVSWFTLYGKPDFSGISGTSGTSLFQYSVSKWEGFFSKPRAAKETTTSKIISKVPPLLPKPQFPLRDQPDSTIDRTTDGLKKPSLVETSGGLSEKNASAPASRELETTAEQDRAVQPQTEMNQKHQAKPLPDASGKKPPADSITGETVKKSEKPPDDTKRLKQGIEETLVTQIAKPDSNLDAGKPQEEQGSPDPTLLIDWLLDKRSREPK